MMPVKRGQGRPPRGVDNGGREKLLEGARAVLRSGGEINLRRQDIARQAGVTPALVTYYFPTQQDLIKASAQPLVERALARLEGIIAENDTYESRLKKMVTLFIEFSAENSRLLDAFIATVGQSNDTENGRVLMRAVTRLTQFFASASEEGIWRNYDPTFFLFSVWGMCKFVADPAAIPISMSLQVDRKQLRDIQATMIVDLLVNGIRANGRRSVD